MFSNNNEINVIKTYVESGCDLDLNIHNTDNNQYNNISKLHFDARHNTEYDFFSDMINHLEDRSNSKFINRGEINHPDTVDEIISLEPELIITYGCSIIKPTLVEHFHNKIINVHLGLSPYYFGSGTNYHALVNKDFQCVGYTFMYIDNGIDTGEIIHQARASVLPFDNPHQIGNRLIKDMTMDFIKLVIGFDDVQIQQPLTDMFGTTYKKKDATLQKDLKLYQNFKDGAVLDYLRRQKSKENEYPIIEQKYM